MGMFPLIFPELDEQGLVGAIGEVVSVSFAAMDFFAQSEWGGRIGKASVCQGIW